jgi:hypothetical protein
MKAMTLTGARVIAPVAAVLAVALGFLLATGGPPAAQAQEGGMLGLDMQPATNDATSLGRLQPCTEAAIGAEFHADIFAANIDSLSAWELRLDYDPDVVALEAADYNQMLVSAKPSGSVFPSLFEAEGSGRHFMAATEISGTPDSGSGVLAHLTLRAVGPGETTLSITGSPTAYGPRIQGVGGEAVGDTTGDGVWDGALTDGTVVVAGDCPQATPIATPGPGSGNGGGGGNQGGGGRNGNGNGNDTASGGGSVAVVDNDNSHGGSSGSGGDGSGTDGSADGSGSDGDGGGSGEQGDDDPAAAGDDGDTDQRNPSSTDDDGGGRWGPIGDGPLLAIAVMGFISVAAGLWAMNYFRRN